MKTLIRFMRFLALAIAGIALAACSGDSNVEADEAAAAYYEEKLNSEGGATSLMLNGPVEKWEAMETSRKMGVMGKVMHVTLGFFHQKSTYPIGKQFILYNDGENWKVLSMNEGGFLTKEQQQQFGKSINKDEIKTPQFGPQEQAALDDWLNDFAKYGDDREKYGEFLDCFVKSGSERWISKDGGNVLLEVYHEKKSTQHVALVRKQEDGSWKAE